MLTCSHYNQSGYQVFMTTCWKGWSHKDLLLHINNTWLRELSYLCYKIEYFTNLDKVTSFVMFCNLELVLIILQELHSGVRRGHFALDISGKFLMLVIEGQPWTKMFMNFVKLVTYPKNQITC
jgi:hypothetical protein